MSEPANTDELKNRYYLSLIIWLTIDQAGVGMAGQDTATPQLVTAVDRAGSALP